MKSMDPLSSNPNDFCHFDTETRALEGLEDPLAGDVTKCGAVRYSSNCKVVMVTWAIGNDMPVQLWALKNFDDTLRWIDAPPKLLDFMARALKGEAWFVAWNSFFDRHVCNRGMVSGGKRATLPVRVVIDAMAQAVAANLPAKLGDAAKALGHKGKMDEGKALIQLFCCAGGATPQSHPEEWERFCQYGVQDTEAMRYVYNTTRPLFRWEWEQFWSSEQINDRGLPVDRELAEAASVVAGDFAAQVNERIVRYTHGVCKTVNQHVALANYVADELEHLPEAFDILVKKYEEDEEGDGLVATGLSLERTRVEKLIAYVDRLNEEKGLTDAEYDIAELLDARLYGASNTPKKFAKCVPMLDVRDRLCGQYVFNGAQQTGRFSARGLQVHNLTRAYVGMEDGKPEREAAAIEFLLDGADA